MRTIDAEIYIAAPPRQVLEIVLDFDRYGEWNPFTPQVALHGRELRVGAELDLHCQMTPTELLENEREVILALDRDACAFCMGTSRRRGRPGIRSFRWQRCLTGPREGTRFCNSERFEGPLAPLVYLLYQDKLARAFQGYCAALKRRAEGGGEELR